MFFTKKIIESKLAICTENVKNTNLHYEYPTKIITQEKI